MPDLSFDQLTLKQINSIEQTFADAIFGVDPKSFVYELDDQAAITGRRPLHLDADRQRPSSKAPVNVTVIEETNITGEMRAAADAALDLLAEKLIGEVSARIEMAADLDSTK